MDKKIAERDEKILRKIEEYGKHCIILGFTDKGTPEYTEAFKVMMQVYGDILMLMVDHETIPLYPDMRNIKNIS